MISAYTCMRYSRDRNVIEALKITKVGAEIKTLNPLQMDCYRFNHFLRKVADWNSGVEIDRIILGNTIYVLHWQNRQYTFIIQN